MSYNIYDNSSSSSLIIPNIKMSPENKCHWNLKFRKFSLKNIPSTLNSDLHAVNKDIIDMPKLNCESKNLDIFWKDLAKDIITPFAPKNHSILRYLHRNSPRKNSPKIIFSDSPISKFSEKQLTKNNYFKLNSPNHISKQSLVKISQIRIHSNKNKSLEIVKVKNETDISYEIINNEKLNKNKQLIPNTVRRKSCHCQQCGNLTQLDHKYNLLPTKIRFHQILLERKKQREIINKLKVQDVCLMKRSSLRNFFPKNSTGNLKMEKSYTNLNFPISAPKSMYEGSFTSFEHLTNTQKKINFYRSSNLSINSDNLSNEKKINKEKEKKINHYRNSTLGFINNSKLCQKKLNTDEFQVNINDPPNIIEEPHQTFFKMKIKSRKNSELEKNTKIKSVLQNKELKKKEVQLYKLLQSKFHSAEHKYLQTISKLQINYSDATAYNTIYYPSKKNINTTSLTPRINNQNNQISILSPLNRKNSWTSPYRLTTNAFFCNSNFKAIRKIGIEKK